MTPSFAAACAALFGLCVGSFLNVVVWRLPRGLSIVRPRSACPDCGEPISALDNLPVLSFLWLRGRCRYCYQPISLRYPLVEATMGAVSALLALRWFRALEPGSAVVATVVEAAFFGLLLALALIDLDLRILPDRLTLPGVLAGLIGSAAHPWLHRNAIQATGFAVGDAVLDGILGAAGGAGLLWGISWAAEKIWKREAMGLGDVKLLALIGAWLGLLGMLYALLVAVMAGAAIGIVVWIVRRDRFLPFGPFLALGGAAVLLAGGWVEWVILTWWPGMVAGPMGG
ncbi:MAG: prepilin peptidase [Planctomycetales bacterium]|nr:prepilin peptidase [Planctomycetales bacterium]